MQRSSGHRVVAAGAMLLAMALIVAGACGSPASSVPSVPAAPPADPTVVPNAVPTPGPTEVSKTADDFRVVLRLPATTISASEPLTGEAVLTTVDGRQEQIAGSGGGVFGFTYREIGGTRMMAYAMTDDCVPYAIPEDGLRGALTPSGGWSEDDPNAAFYRTFAQAPDVRLPAGAWEVTADAVFAGPDCAGPQRTLTASTVVVVTP